MATDITMKSINSESGMREECGVFGIVSTGKWPTDIGISHLIHLGLVGLQHRYVFFSLLSF